MDNVVNQNWWRSSKTSDGRGGLTGLDWVIGRFGLVLTVLQKLEIENEEGNGQNKRT